jgi:pimeloyl-ACP methyl ester carboxylesterase
VIEHLPERYHRTVTLADGRVLAYAEAGDLEGRPLLLFHGTPSSRLDAYWLDAAARRTGWRVIAPDRPGHGGSSPSPGRALVDWPGDVVHLADHLGLVRFGVLGFSGGAPYALVTAHRLHERVSVVGLVSAWGPPDRPGAYRGVPPLERLFDGLARRLPRVSRASFAALRAVLVRAPSLGEAVLGGRISPPDGVHDMAPDAGLDPSASVRESLRSGAAGPAEDLRLIVQPWGFPVGHLAAPVRIWHGERDAEVPVHHAEFLCRIVDDGRLEVVAGRDHLVLFSEADRILGGLAAAIDPDEG